MTTQIATVDQLAFDYSQVAQDQRGALQTCAVEIKTAQGRIQEDIFYIGKRLLEAKAVLEHGRFQSWILVEFSLSYRTAANMMSVAERFADVDYPVNLLPDSSLYMLASPSVPESVARHAAEKAQETGKAPGRKEIKQLIAQSKPAPAPAELDPQAPAEPRPLTPDETEAVLWRVVERNGGESKRSQAAWLALNYSRDNYTEGLNPANVYITRDGFAEAYKRLQIALGNRRADTAPLAQESAQQTAPAPATEPTAPALTPHQQKQMALRAELEFWRQAADHHCQILGNLTGNFTAALPLAREIRKAIDLLKSNIVE